MNNATQKKLRQYVLSRRFDSGFHIGLMAKDLTIALDVGREGDVPAPFAALCRELWAAGAAQLGAGEDHTAIAKLCEALAGEVLTGGNG
jgi:3-hydroxyisobutyrate dehydrogenase